MQYRIANMDDLEGIAQLHAESWRNSYRGIFPDDFLDHDVWDERQNAWASRLSSPKKNQHIIVATDNDEIYGFICAFGYESAQWGTFIDNLHVSNAAQGKGIGKQLLYLIAEWVDESFEHKGLYLEVLEDNVDAQHFYHRLGARHQETNLWQPPGNGKKVNDMLFVWENDHPLLPHNITAKA
jgi:ribosomal protein S18 acetylase RimI-like enzyme